MQFARKMHPRISDAQLANNPGKEENVSHSIPTVCVCVSSRHCLRVNAKMCLCVVCKTVWCVRLDRRKGGRVGGKRGWVKAGKGGFESWRRREGERNYIT